MYIHHIHILTYTRPHVPLRPARWGRGGGPSGAAAWGSSCSLCVFCLFGDVGLFVGVGACYVFGGMGLGPSLGIRLCCVVLVCLVITG